MQLTIVKIGGNVIDDKAKLSSFLQEFALLDGAKILVHGGGKIATETGNKLGIQSQYVNGRRITDAETLKVVTMVYGGLINKNIVAALQALRCNAIGLTGADGNLLPAIKRPVKEIDYGFVGDIEGEKINRRFLLQLIEAGITPVLAPLTHDGAGSLLNTNADTIAQEVAQAMAKSAEVQLIYCFEKKGVLSNSADENSIIDRITEADFHSLRDSGVVSGGMLPKLENALAAVKAGVKRVVIGQAEQLNALYSGTSGTSIA